MLTNLLIGRLIAVPREIRVKSAEMISHSFPVPVRVMSFWLSLYTTDQYTGKTINRSINQSI
jgi:hypothetical protein